MNKKLFEMLDIEQQEIPDTLEAKENSNTSVVKVETNPIADQEEEDPELIKMEKDFEMARENIVDALRTTKLAVEYMFTIAKDKEDAKSFDSLNGLLKNVNDASAGLIDLYRKKEDYKERKSRKKVPDQQTGTFNIDKAVFTGNPNQLREFISKKKD